nr:hypothetical protein Iba_chr02dCG9450 [Ipomoea batatas]
MGREFESSISQPANSLQGRAAGWILSSSTGECRSKVSSSLRVACVSEKRRSEKEEKAGFSGGANLLVNTAG